MTHEVNGPRRFLREMAGCSALAINADMGTLKDMSDKNMDADGLTGSNIF